MAASTSSTLTLSPEARASKVAESGFLISPVVETQADFLAYMRGEGGAEVRSVRIEAPAGHAKFWGGVDARVWRLPGESTGR